MVSSVLHKKLWRDLRSLRAQGLTIAILIICGVSLLVASWSAYESLKSARDSYYQGYAFADVFAELKRAPTTLGNKIHSIPHVERVQLRTLAEGLVTVADMVEPAVGRFLSVSGPLATQLNRPHIRQGRMPEEGEITEVVVHEGFATAHQLKLGQEITGLIEGQEERLIVVGIGISPEFVYALGSAAALPDDRRFGIFWMREVDLQRLMGMSRSFNSVALRLGPGASVPQVLTELDHILQPYGNRGSYARDRQISHMFLNDEIQQQRITAAVFPAIFLGIAAFLIHVIASRLISLQRPQIAVLKAVGYRDSSIATHYLSLVLVLISFGIVPGLLLGASLGKWMSWTYQNFFRFPTLDFTLNFPAVAIGILAGYLPGIIGAWSGLRSIMKLSPAESMRPPAPPAYHAHFLQRWGLEKWFSVHGRMVWRNLFLRPIRTFLSILGMCFAVAIVVIAGFWADTFQFVIATQFEYLQREDLSVQFLRPLPAQALRDLSSGAEVLSAEGYRVVPIRIRYRHFQQETSLIGRPRMARMRLVTNADLQPLPLPAKGVLLDKFFQKKWGIKAGELIEVQILQGADRRIPLNVVGFSDSFIGNALNMEIEQLWSLLDEQPAYDLVLLQTDRRELQQIYARLRNMPQVVGVNLKMAMYRGFMDSFGALIKGSTYILAIFAFAIAVGIIYNSVRVSFSERSWEMASLRVLGFSKVDVLSILMEEISTQVILSLIPGCVLGYGLSKLSLKMIHTETFNFPVVISNKTYALAIATILLALVGSFFIAYLMVKKLDLVEALKARE